MVRLLLQAGHDINALDKQRRTPLMYAAAIGSQEVTLLLLARGAVPHIRDADGHNFLQWAASQSHFALVIPALEELKPLCPPTQLQSLARSCLQAVYSYGTGSQDFESMLAALCHLCGNINSLTDNGRQSLMHKVTTTHQAKILVDAGFDGFNQPDRGGKLPLFSLAKHKDSELIRFCLEHGTNVNHRDRQQRTVLSYLSSGPTMTMAEAWESRNSIELCIDSGLDVFAGDDCVCPCSPGGCNVMSALNIPALFGKSTLPRWFKYSRNPFPWVAYLSNSFLGISEWDSLMEECLGPQASKQFLLQVHRSIIADGMGITHVCCFRNHPLSTGGPTARLYKDDIRRILDEEEELIAALEEEMQVLGHESLCSLRSRFCRSMKEAYDISREKLRRLSQYPEVRDDKPKMRVSRVFRVSWSLGF